MKHQVYILKSMGSGKYYVGQTKDIVARLDRHNRGYEKSTSPYSPWEVVWLDTKETLGEAVTLEKKLKNLSKVRLEQFMHKYSRGHEAATQLLHC